MMRRHANPLAPRNGPARRRTTTTTITSSTPVLLLLLAAVLLHLSLSPPASTRCLAYPSPSPLPAVDAADSAAGPPNSGGAALRLARRDDTPPASTGGDATPQDAIADKRLVNLNANSFGDETKRGAALVEFYSPYCPHCKAFAPTFLRAFQMLRYLEDTSAFKLRRVNCVEQYDLCEAQGVKYYPSLKLYLDGKFTEEYKGDREFDAFSTYIVARAADYRAVRAAAAKKAKGGAAEK